MDIALLMEEADTPETSKNFHQITRCNNLGDSHLHTRCHEKLNSHPVLADKQTKKKTSLIVHVNLPHAIQPLNVQKLISNKN
jgi:hypothetical protein